MRRMVCPHPLQSSPMPLSLSPTPCMDTHEVQGSWKCDITLEYTWLNIWCTHLCLLHFHVWWGAWYAMYVCGKCPCINAFSMKMDSLGTHLGIAQLRMSCQAKLEYLMRSFIDMQHLECKWGFLGLPHLSKLSQFCQFSPCLRLRMGSNPWFEPKMKSEWVPVEINRFQVAKVLKKTHKCTPCEHFSRGIILAHQTLNSDKFHPRYPPYKLCSGAKG